MIRKILVVLILGAIIVTTILFLKQTTNTITIGEFEAKPHINVSLDALKIAITSSPDDKIHVQMQGYKLNKDMMTLTEENDRFLITEQPSKKKWHENIQLRSAPTIILQLPQSQSKTLTLNTVDGDSIIQNVTLDAVQVETAAGLVNLNNLSTSNAELRTKDGPVTITKSAIDNLSIITSAGDVAIQASIGSVHTIQTTDGQIIMTEVIEQPNIHVKSVSGDIVIHYKKSSIIGDRANVLSAESKYGSVVIE